MVSGVNVDGYVKSPIYGVVAIFHALDIPLCMVSHLKNYYALYMNLFT